MFHLANGFYFRREDDGSVTVQIAQEGDEAYKPTGPSVTADEAGWASVLASLCARGENSDTFTDALDFHTATHD